MLSNMPPGDNSGAVPREHYAMCRTNCVYPLTRDDDGEGHENWECTVGHYSHECNCENIAGWWGTDAAEAAAEHLAELDQPAVGPV